jgi:hypothetical protein
MNTIFYGCGAIKLDVTDIALAKCLINNTLLIPSGDNNRAELFGDPYEGTLKSIFINETEYPHDIEISIDNFIPEPTVILEPTVISEPTPPAQTVKAK